MRGPLSPISEEVKSESLFWGSRRGDAFTATHSLPMKLFLEDGSEFEGFAFGAYRPVVGEVVFTTAMSGYVESLTDPIPWSDPGAGLYSGGQLWCASRTARRIDRRAL